MKSKFLSSVIIIGFLMLGSCLETDTVTPFQRLQEDIAKIDAYLLANPPDPSAIIVKDASGIRLVITEMGDGEIPPTPENVIQVAYTGWLFSDGTQFDTDDSYTFTLTTQDAGGDVIAGWKYALAMMTEGTKAMVYIPSDLAYGTSGSGSIPDNAILIFAIELKVVNTDNQEPQLTNDIAKISDYIEENEISDVQVDPSGLRYVIEDVGTGDAPGLYDMVRMRYTGKIMDATGTVFEADIEQGPTDLFSSRVVNYIHGVAIGLQKVNEGGTATFYIPSTLAYGPSGRGVIPANATLIFEVELLEVIPNQE